VKKFLMQEPARTETPVGHRHTIIRHFCKGCRICIAFCPKQVLGLDERFKVAVLHPERCIACRMCELRCPDLAIFHEKKAERGPTGPPADARAGEAAGD